MGRLTHTIKHNNYGDHNIKKLQRQSNIMKTKIMQTKAKQQAKLYRLKAKRRKLVRTLASRGLEVNQEYKDLTHDITVLEMNLLDN